MKPFVKYTLRKSKQGLRVELGRAASFVEQLLPKLHFDLVLSDSVNHTVIRVPMVKVEGKCFSTSSYKLVPTTIASLTDLYSGEYESAVGIRYENKSWSGLNPTKIHISKDRNLSDNSPFRVAVFGSCISRDNFNSRVSKQWRRKFELVAELYQMSFVSQFSSPLQINESDFDDLDSYSKKLTISDFTKSFLDELKEKKPDALIIDLRADIRFGLVAYQNSFITNNAWRIGKSEYYHKLQDNEKIIPVENFDEYLRLFEKSLIEFDSFRKKWIPSTKIILNNAHASDTALGSKDSMVYADATESQRVRPWLALNYLFMQLEDVYVLNAWDDLIQSDPEHPWGKGPLHYESRYYSEFSYSLERILRTEISL